MIEERSDEIIVRRLRTVRASEVGVKGRSPQHKLLLLSSRACEVSQAEGLLSVAKANNRRSLPGRSPDLNNTVTRAERSEGSFPKGMGAKPPYTTCSGASG